MAISNPTVWYIRDNSTLDANITTAFNVGSVGWSALTAWAASTSIAPGSIRRQSGATSAFTASRSGTTLTVTGSPTGTITLGQSIRTTGGSSLGTITALGTGTGGAGTYTTSASGTVNSTTMTGAMLQGNQLAFIATQAASQNTGATEPDWSKGNAKGTKITDGSVTWVECSGQPGVNNDFTNTPNWAASQAASVGQIIKDLAGTHLFICTTAGTTKSGGEPTWSTSSVGSTTTDNTATWTYIGTSFGAWAAPLSTITQASTWLAAGATLYVGDDHAEVTAGNGTISLAASTDASPNQVLSIDHAATNRPPQSGDLLAGAQFNSTTSGSLTLSVGSASYWYGCTAQVGVGLSASSLNLIISNADLVRFDSCTFKTASTGASARLLAGNASGGIMVFDGCSFNFAAATHTLELDAGQGLLRFRNCTFAGSGTVPTTLFNSIAAGDASLEGCDFSAITGTLVPALANTNNYCGIVFADGKLANGVVLATTPTVRCNAIDFIRCASNASTYKQGRYNYVGTLLDEATIVRTGGAADGATGVSWKITTTANAKIWDPFEAFPSAIYNSTIGGNVPVTLCGIWNAAAVPNNDDIWIDVEYLGSSGSPIGSYIGNGKANILATGSALTADSTSAWDSVATARQNSHAYSLGDIYKSANNAGRLFFCTTAGTSASSEPGGIATAVDGGSVTDGAAVFRAGCRFKLTVTLGVTGSSPQPQLAGYLSAVVKAAAVSAGGASTFYIDPLIALS